MNKCYEVLGVPKTASQEDIQKAYRQKAKEHHPDRNPGDADAQRRFREIQEAYDTLSDPIKRNQYDRVGNSMHFRSHGSGFDPTMNPFADMMSEMFKNPTFQGRNLQMRLDVSFEEAFTGCVKEVNIKVKNRCVTCNGHGQTSTESCSLCSGQGFVNVNNAPFEIRTGCPNCNSTGKINLKPCSDCNSTGNLPGYREKKINIQIPSGIDNGAVIRIKAEGEESVRGGGRPGDLLVHIVVPEHPIYRRQGADLIVDIPVSYAELALGSEISLPYFQGEKLSLKVPAGTQSHSKLKLTGKGGVLPNGLIGDLIVTLKVETVKNPDENYLKILEQLATLEKNHVDSRRAAWQKKIDSTTT